MEQGLAESREQAQRLIRAGSILVDGQRAEKPGHRFACDVRLEAKKAPRFVGRGGEKLEAAFETFEIDVQGLVCLDVGASTGGFTDCLLQHGAGSVYAVDVGKGQLHWKLCNDPRVTVIDKTNARYLTPDLLPDRPSFACIDVSFISLTLIMPAVIAVLAPTGKIVSLIKPQFEAGREQVGKGGVVRDEAVREAVVDKIHRFGEGALGMTWHGCCPSPIKGPAGNVEFLALWSIA